MSCLFCFGLTLLTTHQDYILIPYSDALIDRASALVARHVLRALDAIQLASALELTFLSADDRLLDAVRQEHLQAENPEKLQIL